jgi:hypothetical protein
MPTFSGNAQSKSALASAKRSTSEDRRFRNPWGLNCVPARQCEAERSGRIQRDAGELLVKWIHAED